MFISFCTLNNNGLGHQTYLFFQDAQTGHLEFAVLQYSSKSYFQTNLTINIANFWVRHITFKKHIPS